MLPRGRIGIGSRGSTRRAPRELQDTTLEDTTLASDGEERVREVSWFYLTLMHYPKGWQH